MATQARQVDKSTSRLGHITGVQCTYCDRFTPLGEFHKSNGTLFEYSCEWMDGGEYLPKLDIERLRGILNPSVARQRFETSPTYWGLFPELLPVPIEYGKPRILTPDIPFSSLHSSKSIGRELETPNLFFLGDGDLPTGSFKPRAVNTAYNLAVIFGYDTSYIASTGNLVLASIYFGGKSGLNVFAHLPASLSQAKKNKVDAVIDEVLAGRNGNRVGVEYHDREYDYINDVIVGKLIEDHNQKSLEEIGRHTAFSPNRGPRSFYGMGEWTAAFQFVTQLQYQYRIQEGVPINVYIGGGSGKLTAMVTEASKVLQDLGILRNPIRIWSVQPTKNQPLIQGYNQQVLPKLKEGLNYDDFKKDLKPVSGEDPQGTIVESVAIRKPGSFLHTMRSLAHPNSPEFSQWKSIRGGAVAVSDEETADGLVELVEKEGLTPQFVGAMAYGGFKRAVAEHPELRDEVHVVYLTGGGEGKLRLTLEEMAQNDWGGRGAQLARIAPLF